MPLPDWATPPRLEEAGFEPALFTDFFETLNLILSFILYSYDPL